MKGNSKDCKTSGNQHNGNSKITRLVIVISLLYTLGNVPYSTYSIVSIFMTLNPIFQNVTIMILYFYKGLMIFIFYFFNSHYQNVLKSFMKSASQKKCSSTPIQ